MHLNNHDCAEKDQPRVATLFLCYLPDFKAGGLRRYNETIFLLSKHLYRAQFSSKQIIFSLNYKMKLSSRSKVCARVHTFKNTNYHFTITNNVELGFYHNSHLYCTVYVVRSHSIAI